MDFNIFKGIIRSFKENKIRYWVFGGFAFDGIRRKITRDHKDIDIYLHGEDYSKMKFCRLKDITFSKPCVIETVKLTEESNSIIANHRNANTLIKYPKIIFNKNNNVQIDDIKFRILPNEALKYLSRFSYHQEDKSLGEKLKYDEDNFKKIIITKMKTILVDAVNAFIIKGEGISEDMHKVLEEYPNRKIILTGANDEEKDKFGLHNVPYELFTLKHNPEKTDPEYYKKMLKHFGLKNDEVIYFEHNPDAIKSAESVGIKTFYYNKDKKDLEGLRKFLDDKLN